MLNFKEKYILKKGKYLEILKNMIMIIMIHLFFFSGNYLTNPLIYFLESLVFF